MCDLTSDTLCTFSPDPSEQPDARWSAVGNDEDMEANVLYAVATPGILKLWPWVNQVCHCLQHTSTFLSQTRIRRLSRSLPSYLLRLLCRSSQEWGMYTTFTSKGFLLLLFLTGPIPISFQPTCYPRGGFRHARWTHDSQGCLALRAPRATK
jgi:hypothetical protein